MQRNIFFDGAAEEIGNLPIEATVAGTVDNLLGQSVASGTPTVTSGTITQTHVINGNDVASGSPTVTTGTLGQTHVITGQSVASGTPTVTNGTVGQVYALTGASVSSGQPTVTSGTLGQTHVLEGADVASGQPTVTNGTLTEGSTTDALTGQSVESGMPTVTNGTLGIVQDSTPVGNANGGRAAGGPSSRRKRKFKDELDRARQEGRLLKLTDLTGGGGGLDLDALDIDDDLGQQSQPKRRKGKQRDGDETTPSLVPQPLPPSLDATLVQVQRLIADATEKGRQEQLAILAEEQDEEETLELLLLSL